MVVTRITQVAVVDSLLLNMKSLVVLNLLFKLVVVVDLTVVVVVQVLAADMVVAIKVGAAAVAAAVILVSLSVQHHKQMH